MSEASDLLGALAESLAVGGRIEVRSAPGQRATFTVRLPRRDASSPKRAFAAA